MSNNVKTQIDTTLNQLYKQGQLYEDEKFKLGFLQAIDMLSTELSILLTIEDIDVLLDQEHDAVFYFKDRRLYRLDKLTDKKPFIEPLVLGFGGKKRFVEGSKLNGLFPGIMLTAPNYYPKH